MWDLIGGFPREFGIPHRFIITNKLNCASLINRYNGKKRLSFALYQCDSERKYYNPDSGFSANIRLVWFDFDEDDCYDDTVKLHKWCVKHKLRHIMTFSGRGYHIYIFAKNGGRLKNNKDALWNAHHEISKSLNLKLDPQVKGDIARMGRVPNTYNGKRRRYCIPISKDDLNKGHDFIREKAKKQNFEFNYYGASLLDMMKYDTKKMSKVPQVVLECEVKREINADKLLKTLPKCVANMLRQGDINYRQRYLVISFLRDQAYMLSETMAILKKFLTPKKYIHCVVEGRQPQHLYRRMELFFPTCDKIKSEGFCIQGCKWYNKVYL